MSCQNSKESKKSLVVLTIQKTFRVNLSNLICKLSLFTYTGSKLLPVTETPYLNIYIGTDIEVKNMGYGSGYIVLKLPTSFYVNKIQ